jgi:hypothetical protein
MDPDKARGLLDALNHDYSAVHRQKEDLFWAIYMATSDEHALFAEAEKRYKAFVSDPGRLALVRAALSGLEPGELLDGLIGWQALFQANAIEDEAGRAAMDALIGLESELFAKRAKLRLRHLAEGGQESDATLGALATNLAANADESCRESSLRALRGLEEWVLDNGFLEIVKARNAFARLQGSSDYFAYKVRKSEGMSVGRLFEILDQFDEDTAQANARSLSGLERDFGREALLPWNLRFRMAGDLLLETDRYFPFELSLER